MREALARIDHDFVLSEPKRKSAKQNGILNFLQRPKQAVHFAAKNTNLAIGLGFAGLLTAILVNALVFQKDRHPAPLFGHSLPVEAKETKVETKTTEPKSPEVKTAEVKSDAPAPAQRHATGEPAANTPHGRDPMAEIAELQTQKPAAPAPRDPIAQLLKSSPAAPAPAAPAEPSKSVLAAQHALMKLGYVVKPDGLMGGAFRRALEQFERDHKLPVQGTLTSKVMHELSSQSGVTVD